MHRFNEGAFVGEANHPTSSTRTILAGPHGDVLVELLAPREEGKYPFVIYMPGLGEDVQEGQRWRSAWAQAGYAVLAIQRQADGSSIFASDDARSGDFAALARHAFTAEARAQRVATLQFVLNQMDNLARTNGTLFARADRSRIVLAGYDLGADTALACAGEHQDSADQTHITGLCGIIAISPRKGAAAADGAPFADAHLPVLHITSDNDLDPFGLVVDADTRTAPFRDMPPGDKYLLQFYSMSHRELSGLDDLPDAIPSDDEHEEKKATRGRGKRGSGSSSGTGGGMPNLMQNENPSSTEPAIGNEPGGVDSGGGQHQRRNGARNASPSIKAQEQTQVLQSISLAFLESNLKNSARAKAWLTTDASRWTSPLADFSVK